MTRLEGMRVQGMRVSICRNSRGELDLLEGAETLEKVLVCIACTRNVERIIYGRTEISAY